MMKRRYSLIFVVAALVGFQMGGCPTTLPEDVIGGLGGQGSTIGTVASVSVISPVSDFSINGGAPVVVNWNAVATTGFSVVNVIIDVDQDPTNGNEIIAQAGVPLSDRSATIDTTTLDGGTYFLGVVLFEAGELTKFDYASGRMTINQATRLTFSAPRDNFVFDRTESVNPRFDVVWTVSDPDSTFSVQLFLTPVDPADLTNPTGAGFLLRESDSQTGDSFTFDLPTASFDPGVYRILARITDGVNVTDVFAPGTITLRSRLAGAIDLRDMDLPEGLVHGAVFEGFNPRDNAGSFVSGLRDVDGDGLSDFLILTQFGKPQFNTNAQRTGVGEASLIYGRGRRFSGAISLNSVGTLLRGDFFTGPDEAVDPIRPSRGMSSATILSDWDGDGVRDIAFGLPFIDSVAVSNLDSSGYFRSGCVVIVSSSVLRPDLAFPGGSVINLGRIGNIEHAPDSTIVDCTQVPPFPCPEGFYGPKAPGPACTGPSSWYFGHFLPGADGVNNGSIRMGCRFSSNEPFDSFGETISAWQFDSLIISAPNRDPAIGSRSINLQFPPGAAESPLQGAGVISIFYCFVGDGFYPWGSQNVPGLPGNAHLAAIPHGGPFNYVIDDFRTFTAPNGAPHDGMPGYQVSVDTTPCAGPGDYAYMLPDIATRNGGGLTDGVSIRIWGDQEGAALNNAKGVDDFNNDGLEDLLIGAPFVNEGAGACYIVFGRIRDLVAGGEMPVSELGLPINAGSGLVRVFDGLRIVGAKGTRLGQAQDRAGDFNNDGVADVVIGSPLINGRRGGAAVVFGSREVINLTQAEIPFEQLDDRGLGVIFVGEDEGDLAGARVAAAGDIDGDGNDDILIAAPERDVRLDIDQDGELDVDRTDCGVVYLIYGSPELKGTISLADIGTERLPGAVFIGRNSNDQLGAGLGLQGDRSTGIAGIGDVDGDGFGELLLSSVRASPKQRVGAGEAYLLYGAGDN
ncbi:MAG: hypothetical protein KDA32_02295 [Phycisphaerales bacterium]|nr:hypothetical protein [Phycisphaerales bacterium]